MNVEQALTTLRNKTLVWWHLRQARKAYYAVNNMMLNRDCGRHMTNILTNGRLDRYEATAKYHIAKLEKLGFKGVNQ